MADLIAQGTETHSRWRRELPTGRRLTLGRSSGTWAVSWDRKISRHHAEIHWDGEVLRVNRLETARNPIYKDGIEQTELVLKPGEAFAIGTTYFHLTTDRVRFEPDGPSLSQRGNYSFQELHQLKFVAPDERIELLTALPTTISNATKEGELFVRLCNLLLIGTPHADAVAVVSTAPVGESGALKVMHWDRRPELAGDYKPSERLITEAMRKCESVAHVWSRMSELKSETLEGETVTTPSFSSEWAICSPVPGETPAKMAIYLSGREIPAKCRSSVAQNVIDLTDDLKFTSLIAAHLAALREESKQARARSILSHCFSPMIIERLPENDPEVVLAPRITEMAVLSCRIGQRADLHVSPVVNESLYEVMERISQVMRITTYHVLDHGGVMASRHRESVLALWGWPLVQSDRIVLAVHAALGIKTQIEANSHRSGHPLWGFEVNMAIASGESLVGKLGTTEQVEVGVFGPPVDFAERLRALGAALRLPIVIDAKTAESAMAQTIPPIERFRRVVKILWPGDSQPETVFEVLPSFAEYPELASDHLSFLEAAQDAFEAGRWNEALGSLRRVPPEDRVKDFLTNYIALHDGHAPENWSGTIHWSEVLIPRKPVPQSPRR